MPVPVELPLKFKLKFTFAQIFIAVDIDWAKDWEFNCGYGVALTKSTDNSIFKMIVGYRFHHS